MLQFQIIFVLFWYYFFDTTAVLHFYCYKYAILLIIISSSFHHHFINHRQIAAAIVCVRIRRVDGRIGGRRPRSVPQTLCTWSTSHSVPFWSKKYLTSLADRSGDRLSADSTLRAARRFWNIEITSKSERADSVWCLCKFRRWYDSVWLCYRQKSAMDN